MKSLFLALLLLTAIHPNQAVGEETPDVNKWEQNAFQEYQVQKKDKKFIENIGQRTQKSLNQLIKFGTFRMEKRGYLRSKVLLKEWEGSYSNIFIATDFELLDYNHPVFAWLDSFYSELVNVIGESQVKSLHLDDILEINHGIPAVFHPRNFQQEHYKIHFVPFGAAIGYWSVYASCAIYSYSGTNVAIAICMPLGEASRLIMRTISGPLSDFVWNKYNKS